MQLRTVYVVDAVRTPIARFRGALAGVRPDDLAAHVIAELARRQPGLAPAIEQVVFGATNQAGEDNRNVARMALLLAGLSYDVAAVTVNRLCGSGLEAVNDAARMIAVGEVGVAIAGGVESMTRAPFTMPKASEAFDRTPPPIYDTTLGWRYPNPKMAARFELQSMGETAENVAKKVGIGRDEQDAFALASQKKAGAAWEAGAFAREIVPVPIAGKKGEAPTFFSKDESPRPDTTLEKLATLAPAFRAGGTVTAGNSSPINDGAAAVLLASEEAVKAAGVTPLARFVVSATAGVEPNFMGEGPIPATKKALARAGLRAPNLDLVELNEAFAAQSLACIRGLDLDPARVNVNGGAIALGHPIGSSGARIVATLVHAMHARGARHGLASLCIGVGQGIATIFERALDDYQTRPARGLLPGSAFRASPTATTRHVGEERSHVVRRERAILMVAPSSKSPVPPRLDSDAPPSSGPESGGLSGEVRFHAAVRPSDLRNTSDEELAAISVRAGHHEGAAPETPIPPHGVTGFDPMQSYSIHDDGPPSFDEARRGSGTRLLAAPAVKAHEAIGRLVAGRYAVTRLVGAGGMASVLEAEDRRSGERVAIKVMHGDYARDPEIVARFQREARAAAAVDNPHIVRVIDVGRDDVIGLFLVMELLEGEDLGALLQSAAVSPLVACALAWQAADGLARAHEASILHRDVKPANLFLAKKDGVVTVKLLDFGIAKLDDGGAAGLTRVGTVLGTPQYMSPEQAQARALTPRSDVYSLGAVLFEMLARRPLVTERETLQEMLFAAATEAAPPLGSLAADLDPRITSLVDDMLFRDASLRIEMDAVSRRLAALGPQITKPIAVSSLASARTATTEKRLRASGAPTALVAPKPKAPRRSSTARSAPKKELPLVPIVLAFLAFVAAVVFALTR